MVVSEHPQERSLALIGTNCKMNLTPGETRLYLERLRELVEGLTSCRIFVLPSYPALHVAASVLAGSQIAWGAQDVHPSDRGAFTGDVSAPMVAELGCSYVMVGHHERRREYGEDDSRVSAKAAAAQRAGMAAIVCIGEPTRMSGRDAMRLLGAQLNAVADLDPRRIVIAYEPGWAIGTGAAPAPIEWLRVAHAAIRERTMELFSSPAVPVITGGSVDLTTAPELLREPEIDGVFVGRNALDAATFAAIARTTSTIQGAT